MSQGNLAWIGGFYRTGSVNEGTCLSPEIHEYMLIMKARLSCG